MMHTSRPRLSIIASAFLLTGLLADLLPHPALGPGIVQMGLNMLAPAPAEANTPFERSPSSVSTVEGERQEDDI